MAKIEIMKKLLFALATFVAIFQFSACKPEAIPEPKKKAVDHLEFRSTLDYSQDVLENFDLVYDIVSNGRSLTSGTMSDEFKPVEVKSGITEGAFEVHFDFRAKSSFYSTFETWKEYVISFDNMIGLYEIFKDGSEQELISIQGSLRDATFSTFVEEKIPDIIKLMEDALALDNNFSITRDKDGMYFAWL